MKQVAVSPLPIKKAVFWPSKCCTKQRYQVWVIGPHLQIDEEGSVLADLDNSDFIWVSRDVLANIDVHHLDITCHVIIPLQSNVLVQFVQLLQSCLAHNFTAGLLVVSGMIMSFHYALVRELYGGCSIPVAMGLSETGKSTAIKMALGLFGLGDSSHYVRGTNALFLTRSSASILPYAIDDPKGKGKAKTNQLDISELIVDLYVGKYEDRSPKAIYRPSNCQ